MRFISLFTGVGGFDLGFEKYHECVLQVEQDKHCLDVLRRRWPNVPKMEDVRDVTANVKSYDPIDLMAGGFPCQDVSLGNSNRKGLDGERSGLWFEFLRIIGVLEPEWIVIESVPGLLSSNKGRDFATILSGLEELRYGTVWRTLDSKHFGVPQRRRRLFFVGHLGTGRAAEVLFERESLCLRTERGKQKTAPRSTEGCLNPASPQVVFSMNWQSGQGGLNPQEEKTDALVANQTVAVYSPLSDGGVRKLTPTECCRLQGFPDTWNDWLSDAQRYKQMGNAVCVPVAQWIGRRIAKVHNNRR